MVTSYVISYRTIQEVWASISSFKELLLFFICLALNFMGYFEGNYYSEIMYALFGENERFSLDNRKKILNVYDSSSTGEQYLIPISPSINSESDNDYEKKSIK